MDLGLVGDVVIQLTLEQPNLCLTVSNNITDEDDFGVCTAGNPAATYTMSNIYATVRCYSLPSGIYDNMLAEQMANAETQPHPLCGSRSLLRVSTAFLWRITETQIQVAMPERHFKFLAIREKTLSTVLKQLET
jgi:hypothetical protein